MGSAERLRWPPRAGPGHAGKGAQRAPLLGEVRVARTEDARDRPGPPAHLGLLAERDQAGLQGPVLSLRSDDAVLQPRTDRASEDPHLHRRREPVHVPDRGGGLRRPARAPVQQPEVSARPRAARRRRGPPRLRSDAHRLHVHHRELRGRGRHRGRAGAKPPVGEAADRLLRLDAHLRAGARGPRLAGPHTGAASEVGRGRLEGHGRPDHRRDARHVRGHRHLRHDRSATQGALCRAPRQHRALPTLSARPRRPPAPAPG